MSDISFHQGAVPQELEYKKNVLGHWNFPSRLHEGEAQTALNCDKTKGIYPAPY